ncbi:MAG: hypothetical protein LDL11_02585 [Desulfarculus sp.]|nr:hypothetical protein [Desulfarculus sp.]
MVVRWLLALLLVLNSLVPAWAANYADPAYQAAVADAKYPTASKISHDLTPIVAWNPNLVWEGAPGLGRVKMVALTRSYYDDWVGRDYLLSFGELWVTVAPELKQFFQDDPTGPSLPRLEQLLGLPPESGYTRIVEFWVDPADLFRPSADPEITDREAELPLPDGYRSQVAKAYRDWFAATWSRRYETATPYPWTQLGYTYDWGSSNHMGLSEYVIRKGSTVGVAGVWDPLAYFTPSPR